MKRDPRVDPRPGDVVAARGRFWTYEVIAIKATVVHYQSSAGGHPLHFQNSLCANEWRDAFASTEIVKVADAD